MGKLFIVGIGPGNYENMTVRADNALKAADTIIGYHVYVELVRGRYPEKEYLTTASKRVPIIAKTIKTDKISEKI